MMETDIKHGEDVSHSIDKKTQLFLHQKQTLDTFLSNGAITQAQYNKSYGDLVRLMGMEKVAEKIEEKEHGI